MSQPSETDGSDRPFTVVKFTEEFDSNGIELVELVPSSWITQTDQGWQCQWPEEPSDKIRKWIKTLKSPLDNWPAYSVETMTTARDYEKGMQKLGKALKRMKSLDTTEPDTHKDGDPLVLSSKTADKLLKRKDSFLQSSSGENSNDGGTRHKETLIPDVTKRRGNAADNISKMKKTNLQLAEEQVAELRARADSDVKQYISAYMDAICEVLLSSLSSTKRSLQYDLDKKINNLQLAQGALNGAQGQSPESHVEVLGVDLPIRQLEDFLNFEESLNPKGVEEDNQQQKAIKKQSALKKLYLNWTAGSLDWANDIKCILVKMIAKNIQLQYSAAGKLIRGVGKRNFSATFTYKCMEDVLNEKYANRNYKMTILSVTSRWLSGGVDREGGYLARKNKGQNNPIDAIRIED